MATPSAVLVRLNASLPRFRLAPLALALGLVWAGQAGAICVPPYPAEVVPGRLYDLGTLGGCSSSANGISANGGVIVGEAEDSNYDEFAFRWTLSGGMQNLGTLGGNGSWAAAVSADGKVIVGAAKTGSRWEAFRWTASGGMQGLGVLVGDQNSYAHAVSADGSVIVGRSVDNTSRSLAFRWKDSTMTSLGTLGGTESSAEGVSADGRVVVGWSTMSGGTHAFRWVEGATGGVSSNPQMYDLGTLGGSSSFGSGVSADGRVVVGHAFVSGDSAYHAFRWVEGATGGVSGNPQMYDLGVLSGGAYSYAYAVSADGYVVVGESHSTNGPRAFRWTQATGMKSVEDWLRSNGVNVPTDITRAAYGVSADGRVVVGVLDNNHAFWASPTGLITPEDLQESLASVSQAGISMIRSGALLINGAHSRPLARRVAAGKSTFWAAGDWGRDDHGARDGTVGLAEVGFGRNFGPVQLNASLGQTWAKQDLILGGRAKSEGTYLLAQALMPIGGALWGIVDGFYHWGDGDIRRGYINAGAPDASLGKPDIDTWGLRARLQWEDVLQAGGMRFSPYADLSYSEAKMDAYTESGGGLPAQFASRKDKATELRLGIEGRRAVGDNAQFIATLEAAQRFEKNGGNISGEVIGLFPFDLKGPKNERSWLKVGAGVEGKVGGGTGHLMLNATSKGETANLWLAAGWRMAF